MLQSMDDARGVALVDVDLPRSPAPPPSSRTVQPEGHPNLIRAYSEPTYPLRVARLPGGRLLSSGGVATSDGRLIFESLWDEPHLRRDFDPPPTLPAPRRLAGRCASLISLWCDNYFHWIFNSLPRLAVLRASGIEYDRLIVPEPLKPFQRDTLELLGVTHEQLVPFTGQHIQADELVWAAPLAPINEPSSFLLDWVRRSLSRFDERPHRRIYVSRAGGTRKAANEPEVYGALEPLGFEFVLPEKLPFSDQVRLFAQTRLAVGPHGSNFVGAVWGQRMSVFEFFQPAHVNHGVYSVLCAAGVDHWNILCEPVKASGARRLKPRRFQDMHVPVELVLETVSRIESERAR